MLPVVSKSRRGLFMQRKRKAKRGVKERMASWGILVACFVGAFWTVTDWAAEFKADVAAGAKFCSKCGKRLGSLVCPKCNKEVAPTAKFCGGCGKKLA